jgi:hypothetical protein
MTPKEKAKELVDRLYNLQCSIASDKNNFNKEKGSLFNDKLGVEIELYWHEVAKQYALIAVDECINIHFNLESDRNGIDESFKYWQEVKQEIEKL